ncbi:hypothetical protein PN613_19335 [Parabacteroides distasonis]|uniref:hypothetical protein n=1 Tax=Parabacteroides distasonis TaxID=823 RepID=UPI001898F44C|nr:hypothetical protein [Parabacteroides distasonis]MDB8998368.1 hypothetical protein [Parabacteroides distasonis]MDB9073379.1 hypothetical protein [Parabacteroides distasonis]
MMRRYILYDLLTAIVASLCLCGLFTACGEDRGGDLPDDDPNSCLVTITLRASQPVRPPQTKAGETITWENDDEYERDITDWLVVAYDESGVLAGYTSSGGTYNREESDSRTDVNMRLPVGTYRFYAFANLTSLEGGEALLEKIKNTNPVSGDLGLAEEALARAVNILASGNSIDGRNGTPGGKFGKTNTEGTGNRLRIPMSSYAQEHTLSPAPATNTFEIPLIRMIGKVKVEITNNLLQAITVNKLDIMNLRKGSLPIWLLPWGTDKYLEFEGNVDLAQPLAPDFPNDAIPPTVNPEDLFTEAIVPGDDEKQILRKSDGSANGSVRVYTRYIPETNAVVGAGGGGIQLGVEIRDRPRTEHLTGFDFVRRNDLLIIPVQLTNITTKLEVAEQRLPIGVYPTVLTYGEKTGVQVLAPVTHMLQAAGDLSIRFAISQIDGVADDFSIKGYQAGEDGSVVQGEKFSFINWKKNDQEGSAPLITSICVDGENFIMNEGDINIPQTTLTPAGDRSKKGGSFTIRTQELGEKAEATIILTLVVNYIVDGEKQEMQIPYTIKIRNYKEQQP